ncbi:zeta-sarcoglycan [Plakobranchus ocellatus]|uniref:Zeta-sarcoglycan n=1 Tax=Plakobranchus ocellatus TaxID=259542 RepID=A0AAV4CDF9_9GAST|nr:zeta-sarcoglycan [Plakobranchus ocellatus]
MEDTDQRMSGMFDLDPGPPPAPPQPVGIYGWRKRCLYASVLVLLISVVLNLALTIWILRVLNFPLDGMGTLQVNPSGFSLRGEAEFLKTVYVEKLQSEREKPLYILSDNKVQLTTSDKNGTENSQFVIDENSIEATCDIFHVKDLNNKTQMLLNGSKVTLGFPDVGFPGSLTIKDSVKVPSVFGHDGKPLV